MADLATTTTFALGYYAGSPVIGRSAEASDTVLKVTAPFLDNDGGVVTGNYLLGIVTRQGVETVYVPEGGVSADGLTLTDVVRGIKPFRHTDIEAGDSAYAYKLAKGDRVFSAVDTVLLTMLQEAVAGGLAFGDVVNAGGNKVTNVAMPTDGTDGANKDYVDGIAIAGGANASASVKGLVKLSVAPASSVDPIAVGSNDPRVPTALVAVSAGASDAGKTPKLTGAGTLDASFVAMTGEIRLWAAATAPVGWLTCDGAAVSRTTYAALFAVIGTAFGSGNGATTFNVPDFRGRMPVGDGTGTASGATAHAIGETPTGGKGGEEKHLLTSAESGLPAHTHTEQIPYGGLASGPGLQGSNGSTLVPYYATLANTPADAAQAHNIMPPYVGVRFIIRY